MDLQCWLRMQRGQRTRLSHTRAAPGPGQTGSPPVPRAQGRPDTREGRSEPAGGREGRGEMSKESGLRTTVAQAARTLPVSSAPRQPPLPVSSAAASPHSLPQQRTSGCTPLPERPHQHPPRSSFRPQLRPPPPCLLGSAPPHWCRAPLRPRLDPAPAAKPRPP